MKLLRSLMIPVLVAALVAPSLAVTTTHTRATTTHKTTMRAAHGGGPAGDIVTVASRDKNLSTFVKAVRAAGLESELKGNGPFTVFAPTNYAFGKLPKGTLQTWMRPENKSRLRTLLLNHVVKGNITSANIMKSTAPMTLASLGGAKITIKHTGKTIMVDGGRITSPDLRASNGTIHAISMVLGAPTKAPTAKKTTTRTTTRTPAGKNY